MTHRDPNNVMLYLGGSTRSYRCEVCSCNVFTCLREDVYRCNACEAIYETEPKLDELGLPE